MVSERCCTVLGRVQILSKRCQVVLRGCQTVSARCQMVSRWCKIVSRRSMYCRLVDHTVIAYNPTFASPVKWDQAD